jgi:hypothetical protein
MTPCSPVELKRRFGGVYCRHPQAPRVSQARNQHLLFTSCLLVGLYFGPETGGSTLLRNVCELLPDYTASQPRRQYVGFEVLTPVVKKISIFWDITPCNPLKQNRRFGETFRVQLQRRRINQARNQGETSSK